MAPRRTDGPQHRMTHDAEWFTALYHKHAPDLHGFLRTHYPDVPPHEIVNDTFSAVWEKRDRVGTNTNIETHLRKEASLRAVAYRRRHDEEQPYDGDLPLEPDRRDPERYIVDRAHLADTGRFIDTLPPLTQVIVRFRIWYELKYRVIAENNDMREPAARKQGNRALSELREHLKKAGYGVLAWITAQFASKQHTPLHDMSASAHHAGAATTMKAVGASLIVTASAWTMISMTTFPDRALALPDSTALVIDAPASLRQQSLEHRRETERAAPLMREPATAPAQPPKRSTPQVELPARAELHLSPDISGGQQERHSIEIDSPAGILQVEGKRTATGPSSLYAACTVQPAACPEPDPQSADSTDKTEVPPLP